MCAGSVKRGCTMVPSMDMQPPHKKGLLTPEAFASFLLWLSPDQAHAARKYLELRSGIVKLFIRKGCAHADELADRTLDRVVSIAHLEPGKYGSAFALSCGVARNVWLEYLREQRHEPLEDDRVAAPQIAEDSTEEEAQCLSYCLERLSIQDRDLIVKYHQFQGREKIETRKQLADAYGGHNRLRVTAYRIRVRLHDCISSCVQRSAYN
jgi:DNA-directed RNA polymerase specialized sigma24 family protein